MTLSDLLGRVEGARSAEDDLDRLLSRPFYVPRPTRDEIVGAAIRLLHEKLSPYRKPALRALIQLETQGTE